MRSNTTPRRGATTLEAAVVVPMVLLVMIVLVVGGLGVFRYQEVAAMAREASRYASTHGASYRKDAGLSVGTPADWRADIQSNVLVPWSDGFDPHLLTYTVNWSTVPTQPGVADNWPGATVTVTVSYQWLPEFYFVGPITLTSTSTATISN